MLDLENLIARRDLERQSKINNERAYIIQEFVDAINLERVDTKWKPVQGRAIAIILSPIKKKEDLYLFLSECRDYQKRNGSFGKRFFGGRKDKNKLK